MRDAYMKAKNKKLGSGSAARKIPRDDSMSFLSEIKTTNTRFASSFPFVQYPFNKIGSFILVEKIISIKRSCYFYCAM